LQILTGKGKNCQKRAKRIKKSIFQKMLTNKQIKLINFLHAKKGRSENQLFLVEGEKGILELLQSDLKIHFIILNETLMHVDAFQGTNTLFYYESENTIAKLSTLVSNNFGVAVVQMPSNECNIDVNTFTVVLDGIRDPGNLGTIIRICDWYGISQLVLSNDCTEYYNPKTISSSMGSFLRLQHQYVDLEKWLSTYPKVCKIGALLDGENIHTYTFPQSGFIVFGNESNGIRESIRSQIDQAVTIPRFGSAESLNVGISCAVFLDNLRRGAR
jgi:TrmH family RNA methyltransferase